MYAQVVFNLPIEGPFDYLVNSHWERKIKPGMRAEVSFGKRRCIGYIVGKSEYTRIKKVKPILRVIDEIPILDKTMLKITRNVADYYACSWGEAIEASLPLSLRRGKGVTLDANDVHYLNTQTRQARNHEILLLRHSGNRQCWEIYMREIRNSLNSGRAVIFLSPDRESAELDHKEVQKGLNMEVGLLHSYRSTRAELSQWIEIKNGKLRMVVGTRLAVFAPLTNLGLIIIEEEQSPVYKQDSSPHYNAVGVAKIRARIEGIKLILSSHCPSLDAWYQAKKGKIRYIFKNNEISTNNIRVIDLHRVGFIPQRRRIKISVSLEDEINKTVNKGGRILLFLNRRGFAIFVYCHNCGMVLRCPRCNANLILHFKNNHLVCHRCNYKSQTPRICPRCNSGYLRYSGLGTEKLESELNRLYPHINIACLDKKGTVLSKDIQIIISTESIFKHRFMPGGISNFDLVGVISVDSALNRPDFRAAEKVFSLLLQLVSLTDNSLVIQTNFPSHYCFEALLEKDIDIFYERELHFRRQLRLPPFEHVVLVRLRGKKENRVASVAEELFHILCNSNKDKSIKVVSYAASVPHKERDRFYEQILIKTRSVVNAVSFLKKMLNNFRRSGIIITLDVDPV